MSGDPLRELTRRRLIELSAGGYLGLNLGGLWSAAAIASERAASSIAPARSVAGLPPLRSCVLLFLYGGPSQLETWDLKPGAPAEVRGEFRPISTSVPGVQISEHLPGLSQWIHRGAIIRSMTHAARLHDSASIHALTGRPLEGPDRELFAPQPQTTPSYGSVIAWSLRQQNLDLPFAALPFQFRNVHEVPCQGGGILGSAFDPLRIDCDPATKKYQIRSLEPIEQLNSQRIVTRRHLLDELDPLRQQDRRISDLYGRAYRLMESSLVRRSLSLDDEPVAVRDKYGIGPLAVATGEGGGGGNGAEMGYARELRGQNLLVARRLVEAGVPFVNVYDFRQQGQNWDAHFQGASQHRRFLLPQFDLGLSALLSDLEERGLLETTLVIAMGEFGRTPTINNTAGRDHWPDCYSIFLAGGGVQGGAVYGSSDRFAAYPATDPVTPGDLAATIFWRFGLDPAGEIHDQLNRPFRLATGEPLPRLFGA